MNKYSFHYFYIMSQDPVPDRLSLARKHLLESEYGRFDLIPGIVPASQLLQAKPRQVAQLIARKLEIPVEQVGMKALYSWLVRFKERHARALFQEGAFYNPGETDEGKEEGDDWRDFKPSEPRRQETQEGDLLGFPNYD
jgi:hypothetical protein